MVIVHLSHAIKLFYIFAPAFLTGIYEENNIRNGNAGLRQS